MWSREAAFFVHKTRRSALCAQNFFARRSATRESTRTGGELSANAERISENPTEHLAANYNYYSALWRTSDCGSVVVLLLGVWGGLNEGWRPPGNKNNYN